MRPDLDAPSDPFPTEEQMDADFQKWEESIPEALRYHPLIVNREWDWTTKVPNYPHVTRAELEES